MKSEKVWKMMAISVALLMVASVAGAVNQTGNSLNDAENKALDSDGTSSADASSVSVDKHPKMSTEVAEMIPPPGIAPPAKPVIVNIYLAEDSEENIEELKNYTIEILYVKENRIVAEIYTSNILEIVDLSFVTYIETPLEDFPEIPSEGEVSCADSGAVYKHPKMNAEVAANIPPPGIAPPAKPMTVNIYMKENKTEYIEELKNYTIETYYIKEKRVVAEIYTSKILEITDLPFVTYIETPLMDFTEACSGAVISEGVECINADKLQKLNITGKGVKIAILDSGFDKYEECQRKCELPKNITVISFRGDGDITGKGIKHGTGCAEIVHDVAPDAELYLVNYRIRDELEEAVNYLIEEKVDIITRSAGYLVGLFDGSDEICRIIDDVVFKHGIIWVNSAGNYAQGHWEGMFSDTDEPKDGWHEYSCTGGELGQTITATKGEIVILMLSWNDTWNYATQDYDMHIFDSNITEVKYMIPPTNPQTGLEGHHPYEIGVFISPSNDIYYIAIRNYSATRPVHFELYSPYSNLGCKVENSSLNADACAFGVIAAGAVACEDCSTLEPYSSRGPTNDGRIKPDFVGPDCVSTHSYLSQGYPFCGTSAAAPHVAGAIALQLSCLKESPPGQEANQTAYGLIKPCIDQIANTTQKDNLYGYGLPVF